MDNLYESWRRGDANVTQVYDGEIGKGGCGEVYRVCLYANNHDRVSSPSPGPEVPFPQMFPGNGQTPPTPFPPSSLGIQRQNSNQRIFKFARKHTRPFGLWFTEEAMRKEIQATEFLAQGRNPNLVEILGCGQFREPYSKDFYIDMELCRGSLEQFLNALDGPAHHQFCQYEIWRVMHQITSGVEYIHARNTVHRDLKPPNVLFSIRDGVWKVADFGTAARGSYEQTGTVLGRGTTSYRAPEVSEGIFSVYSDVWGLGCILWKLLTKRDCFPDDPSLLTFVQGYRLYLQRIPVPWRPVRFPLSGNVRQNAVQYQSNIDATLNIEPRLRPTSSALKQLFQMILNS